MSTQSITTIIASASAAKKPVIRDLGSGSSLVSANAKMPVKMISGRIASFAAAAIGLVGTIARRKSTNGGTSPTLAVVVSAFLSASADSAGIGISDRNSGVRIAPITADNVISATIHASVRPATTPALAASAVCAMPVTSSATTSGTIVMRSPFSHRLPTGSAMLGERLCPVGCDRRREDAEPEPCDEGDQYPTGVTHRRVHALSGCIAKGIARERAKGGQDAA